MATMEHGRDDAATKMRRVHEETLSHDRPDAMPSRPDTGRTLGIVGAICVVLLVVLAVAKFS